MRRPSSRCIMAIDSRNGKRRWESDWLKFTVERVEAGILSNCLSSLNDFGQAYVNQL